MRYAIRNISLLPVLVLMLSVLTFTSCIEEIKDEPAPYIEFVTEPGYLYNDTVLLLSDSVLVGIYAETNSSNELTHLKYSFEGDSSIFAVDSGFYSSSLLFEKWIIKGIVQSENWSFYVKDRYGRKSETISIIISLDSSSVFGEIIDIPSIVLGAQNNITTGGFYSLNNNLTYSAEEATLSQSAIDLIYFYDLLEGEDNSLGSPGANIDESVFPSEYHPSNWSVRNTTRYIQTENIIEEDYINCNNDSLILSNTFEFATGKRKAKNLTVGDIYSFVNDSGDKGLFKVLSVDSETEGTVEISIKMQK